MTLATFPTQFPPQVTPVVDSKGLLTTPWMSVLRAVYGRTGSGTGIFDEVANQSGGNVTTDWVLGSGSFILPALTGGQTIVVQDTGGGSTITPPSGATIDGGGSYSLTASKMQIFWFFSATQIFSTQLG